MRKKLGIVFMSMGAVMLVAALSLLLYNYAENNQAGIAVDEILPSVIAAIEEPEPETAPEEENPLVNVVAVDEYGTEMTVVYVDGYGYIGYISIPVLELELPVMSEWDYVKLKTAPCRYFGSTKTDDLVICGHNYSRHFGRLKYLKKGDLILFTDMDGVTIYYEVKSHGKKSTPKTTKD